MSNKNNVSIMVHTKEVEPRFRVVSDRDDNLPDFWCVDIGAVTIIVYHERTAIAIVEALEADKND